jgi:hypothetical protein
VTLYVIVTALQRVLAAVAEFEFNGVRDCARIRKLLPLEVHVSLQLVFGEHIAFGKEVHVFSTLPAPLRKEPQTLGFQWSSGGRSQRSLSDAESGSILF